MAKKRVIILHRSLDTSETISNILRKNGFFTEIARDIDDCVRKIQEGNYLVLVDALFPREKLLSVAKEKKIKILYIASNGIDRKELVFYENVVGFINEPFEIEEFLERVKEACKRVG